MKFVNDQNKSNGHSKIVANEVDKQCDNVTVGASFNTDEGMRRVACADNHSDNPYAELEFYLENVKVSNFSVFFLVSQGHLTESPTIIIMQLPNYLIFHPLSPLIHKRDCKETKTPHWHRNRNRNSLLFCLFCT